MGTFYSRADLYEIGRRYVLARANDINPNMIDTEGSDINLFVGAASYMAYSVIQQAQNNLGELLIDGADDEALDRIVWDRLQETRKGATAAVTFATVSRPTAAAGAGTVATGTTCMSLDGIEYVMLQPANFGALSLQASEPVMVRAAQAGKEFQVGANTIRRFAKPSLLFDQTLQINNDEASAGGEAAEGNDQFRERARSIFKNARRGTLGAIELGALMTSGVVSAQAIEVLFEGTEARIVELFLADSSGVANTALAARVRQTMVEFKAAGIGVVYNTSRPIIQQILLRLSFRAGIDTGILTTQIRQSIVEYVNSLGVNQPLYRNSLGAVLSRFRDSGLLPDEGSIVEPLGDVYPVRGTTIRTRLENVITV